MDGTISRIVPNPALAVIDSTALRALRRLHARLDTVSLISGRSVSQLRAMVRDDGLVLVGNHGLETWDGRTAVVTSTALKFLGAIERAAACLRDTIVEEGVWIEEKGIAVAVHYRLARDPRRARDLIVQAVGRCADAAELRLAEGRRVFELLPPVEVDKGSAVRGIVRSRGLAGIVYLGDDATDVDAFRAIAAARDDGKIAALLVAVSSDEVPSDLVAGADFVLQSVDDVARMLRTLADDKAIITR